MACPFRPSLPQQLKPSAFFNETSSAPTHGCRFDGTAPQDMTVGHSFPPRQNAVFAAVADA